MVKIVALIGIVLYGCSHNSIKEQMPEDKIQAPKVKSPIKIEDIPNTPSEQIIEIES